jgi:Caspase domain
MKLAFGLCTVMTVMALAQGQQQVGSPPVSSQQKYALVIGITGYKSLSEREAELKYADHDANDFAAFIETTAGGAFFPDHVHLVTNASATRDRIFAEFRWLYETAGPNDLVYVFFSGHGAESGSESYLLPANVTTDNLDSEGIPMSQFFRKVTTDLSAKQVVVFIDACRAASAVSGARAVGEFDVAKQWDQHNAKEGQLAMGFFSSLANQKSFEDPELGGGHGLFTWYLLEGMRGGAERTAEGWITAASVLDYTRRKVELRSQSRFQSRQTPIGTPDFRTDFTLAFSNAPILPSSETSSFGLIRVSSVTRGVISIDGKEMGEIIANGRKTFSKQAVGPHKVALQGTTPESIDVVVESGEEAEANFGIVSPFSSGEAASEDLLHINAIKGMSGEVYVDNYRVGHLEVDGQITVARLTVGAHICKVIGPGQTTEYSCQIEKSKPTTVTVAPQPPTGLTVTVY